MYTEQCDKCINMYLKIISLKEDIEDLEMAVNTARFFIFFASMVGFALGIATGLTICCKYKDSIMKSRSSDNFLNMEMNHQMQVTQPKWESPILASAPPPPNAPTPLKLTIE